MSRGSHANKMFEIKTTSQEIILQLNILLLICKTNIASVGSASKAMWKVTCDHALYYVVEPPIVLQQQQKI